MSFKTNILKSSVMFLIVIGLTASALVCYGGEMKLKKVILLGDSIRMGYQNEVIKKLKGKATVWSPKENCQDSAFVIRNLDKWLTNKDSDIIYINCGLHDIFLDSNMTCRRSPEKYAENLDIIFTNIRKLCKNAVIIFALTTPVDEAKQKTSKTYGRLVRRNSDVDKYNAVAIKIAGKHNIKTDNLNVILKKAVPKNMLVSDGIHLNGKGIQIVSRHIADKIIKIKLGN
jgi:isoamyl acetate esterase